MGRKRIRPQRTQRGWPAPKLITVTQEAAALNAALSTPMVRKGTPAAVEEIKFAQRRM